MKLTYKFGNGITEGKSTDKDLLGGKGANLQEMSGLGLPVPPGFTIPTTFTKQGAEGEFVMSSVWGEEIKEGLSHVEADLDMPPLYSVRSGSRISMPGMMDTILNLGLTDDTIPNWYPVFGRKVAYDSYCRLIRMMGESIFDIPGYAFDKHLNEILGKYGLDSYYKLHSTGFYALSTRYKKVFKKFTGSKFPQTFNEQLEMAITGVFKSWNSPRAIEYRKIHNIPDSYGTAVTVQRMVFGNKNNQSMTGVLFSRDPNSGEKGMVGEYLVNAQGEDVVNGSTTPKNIKDMFSEFPFIYGQLSNLCDQLESHYKDMQDIEFTVEDGELFVLQTRTGKRTAKAAFKIVRDMYEEKDGLTEDEVFSRITSAQYYGMKVPLIDPEFKDLPHYTGLAAGGPVVSGIAVTSAQEAVDFKGDCILVTEHTTPDDVAGMNASKGILTRTGGMTCHAAVVGRGMNKTCVVGCGNLPKNIKGKKVTIDGHTGNIWIDVEVPMVSGENNEDVKWLEGLIRKSKGIHVVKSVTDDIDDNDIIAVRKDSVKTLHTKLADAVYEAKEFKTLYLTLESDMKVVYYEQDKEVHEMFGEEVSQGSKDLKNIVDDLVNENISNYAERLVVILPNLNDEGSIQAALENHGYHIPKRVKTIEDLMSDNILNVGVDFVNNVVGSNETYVELVKCLQTAGKTLTTVPVAMSIEEAVNQYL